MYTQSFNVQESPGAKPAAVAVSNEDPALQASFATVHYEYYDELFDLDALLEAKATEIQCVVGNIKLRSLPVLPFGKTQEPGLSDYADGVDVMDFLTKL